MINFLVRLLQDRQPTFYRVSKDGALVLDREGLLKEGKMKVQLDAALELNMRVNRASFKRAAKTKRAAYTQQALKRVQQKAFKRYQEVDSASESPSRNK